MQRCWPPAGYSGPEYAMQGGFAGNLSSDLAASGLPTPVGYGAALGCQFCCNCPWILLHCLMAAGLERVTLCPSL